jgi:predicted XRE-type DNA-binding protein
MTATEILERIRAVRAEQAAEEIRHAETRAQLGTDYAALVAELVSMVNTQGQAAALLGVSQSRVAALVKRARALAGQP